ncbi:hypothetical protein [Neisseria sp.]|uniref:hypothetical protein n=1 Tax=Neisseria sp. TaxID=192066 RepID=UPI0035A0A412
MLSKRSLRDEGSAGLGGIGFGRGKIRWRHRRQIFPLPNLPNPNAVGSPVDAPFAA